MNAIEQAELELQRDKSDLKRLKKRYPGYDFVPVDPNKQSQHGQPAQPRTEFSELELAVLSVVDSDPDKEWTSRAVFESLRAQHSKLPEKEDAAMNAVGAALIELKTAEKIIRTFEGKGRLPHRYSAIRTAEKEATPEEIAS